MSTADSVMMIRRRIWPRTVGDFCSMLFVLTIVPLIYWFELWVVLPNSYRPGSVPYYLHFLFGNFIMLNIVGNFTYAVLCDTSIARVVVPASTASQRDGWRLCAVCETLAPPRSWHCATCDACILKRDHHCIFTGCCVGHFNHRYFLAFLLYLFVATAYATWHNNYFIWPRIDFEFPMSLVKMVFPLAYFVFGFDGSVDQLYLMLYIVSVVGMLYTGVLCFYHFRLVLNGTVANEENKRNFSYDLGWRQNLKEVLGDRWCLALLLPYVASPLARDGLSWDTKASWRENSEKSR